MAERLLLPPQVLGADGRPVSGALLNTYTTGTSTPKAVYSDAALTVALSNPVVADSAGRFPAMFLSAGDYRAVLTDAAGTTIATYDPIEGAVVSSDGAAGQFVSINDGPVSGLRNYIINGDFSVHQRNTGPIGITGYPVDRWVALFNGGTMVSAREALAAETSAVITGDEASAYNIFLDVAGGAGASDQAIFLQRIEGVKRLSGKTLTLSFYARRLSGSGDLGVELGQSFGTGGSPSPVTEGIGSVKCTLTANYQKYSISVEMPSAGGKTFGTNGDDYTSVNFWASAGSSFSARSGGIAPQTVGIQILDVQLEVGPVASLFERRPPQVELAMCQRYYWNTFPPGVAVAQNAGTTGAHQFGQALSGTVAAAYPAVNFPVSMRATPTLTGYNPSAANSEARNAALGADYSSTVLTATGPRGFGFVATGAVGSSAGNQSLLHVAASAEL